MNVNDALASLVEMVVVGSTLLTFLTLLGFIVTDIFHERKRQMLFSNSYNNVSNVAIQQVKAESHKGKSKIFVKPEVSLPALSLEMET